MAERTPVSHRHSAQQSLPTPCPRTPPGAGKKTLDMLTIGVYTPFMLNRGSQSELAKSKAGECVCGSLRRAARAVTQLYDEVLRPTGLRITQLGILGATIAMEPITISRLAEATVTDRTTLTRNLKLLEKQGLIRMNSGTDRREREVALTDQGRDAVVKALPHWQKAQTDVVKALGEERWKLLRQELSAVVSLTRGS